MKPTDSTNRTLRSVLVIATAIFLLSLLPRLTGIGLAINVDEVVWTIRGPSFYLALADGRLADTFLRHHPGVTNMWEISAALGLRYLLRGLLPPGELVARSTSLYDYMALASTARPAPPMDTFVAARLMSALITSACLAGIYLLSRRLFGHAVAIIAAAILLLEPFFLAYQRSITTDANQTNFTWLALLTFLVYARTRLVADPVRSERKIGPRARLWVTVSGVFFGLALLSKVPALLVTPVFGITAAWVAWQQRAGRKWLRVLGDLLLWGVVILAVILVSWPTLWVDLPGTLSRLYSGLGGETDGHDQFLFGHYIRTPGPVFYPVMLLARLSPLLLTGSLWGIVALALPNLRKRIAWPAGLALVLLSVIVMLLGVSFVKSKHDRYIVPMMPGLALIAAAGIWAGVGLLLDRRSQRTPPSRLATWPERRRLRATVGAVVGLQLLVLLPSVPYYLTYFSPFVGGPPGAYRLLMVGNGELMDQAADWLRENVPPGATVGSQGYTSSLAADYRGALWNLQPIPDQNYWPFRESNYVVLYSNQMQRRIPPDLVDYYAPQKPLHVVRLNGVNYVLIYPGPAVRPEELATLPNRTDLNFGGLARLEGYEIQNPEATSGDSLSVALYWEPLGSFPAPDYTVYLGLRDADGNRFGHADQVPGGGMLPVERWVPGHVLRDVHQVPIAPGTPPGEYILETSLFSLQQGSALEARDAGGGRGTLVPIGTVSVTASAAPGAAPRDVSGLDLGDMQRLTPPMELEPQGPRLLAYEWPAPATAQAGEPIPIAVLWQAGESTPGPTELYLQLSSAAGDFRRSVGHPLGGAYPPEHWSPDQLVRDAWQALLPTDAPAGRYRVSLVAAGNGAGSPAPQVLLPLGEIDLIARQHTFEPPQPVKAQAAVLGDLAQMVGYDLFEETQPGQSLQLTLHWRALAESSRSLVRFVHLLDQDGRIVAQQDAIPGDGALPMTGWVPGEYLADQARLDLPADLPAGAYRLAVGFYDPGSGQRLGAADGQNAVLLDQPVVVR